MENLNVNKQKFHELTDILAYQPKKVINLMQDYGAEIKPKDSRSKYFRIFVNLYNEKEDFREEFNAVFDFKPAYEDKNDNKDKSEYYNAAGLAAAIGGAVDSIASAVGSAQERKAKEEQAESKTLQSMYATMLNKQKSAQKSQSTMLWVGAAIVLGVGATIVFIVRSRAKARQKAANK